MIKKILSVIVFLLVANAGFHFGMVFLHDQNFQDAVREVALFGAGKSDDALRAKVMQAAADNQVTALEPDYVDIRRSNSVGIGDHVVIKYAYAVKVQLLPGYTRVFEFSYTSP